MISFSLNIFFSHFLFIYLFIYYVLHFHLHIFFVYIFFPSYLLLKIIGRSEWRINWHKRREEITKKQRKMMHFVISNHFTNYQNNNNSSSSILQHHFRSDCTVMRWNFSKHFKSPKHSFLHVLPPLHFPFLLSSNYSLAILPTHLGLLNNKW